MKFEPNKTCNAIKHVVTHLKHAVNRKILEIYCWQLTKKTKYLLFPCQLLIVDIFIVVFLNKACGQVNVLIITY